MVTRDQGLKPASGWLAVIVVWLLLQLSIGAVGALAPSALSDIVMMGACELLVLGSAVIVLSSRLLSEGEGETSSVDTSALALRRLSLLGTLMALVIGAAINPAAEALRSLMEMLWTTPEEHLEAKMELLRHDTTGRVVALFVVVGCLGPFAEELFFRGVLYTRIARHSGARWAAGVTCIGFAFTHPDVRDWPSLLLVGAVLTWLRHSTGSVLAPTFAHVAFNTCTLVLLTLLPGFEVGGVLVLLGLLIAGVLLWLARR